MRTASTKNELTTSSKKETFNNLDTKLQPRCQAGWPISGNIWSPSVSPSEKGNKEGRAASTSWQRVSLGSATEDASCGEGRLKNVSYGPSRLQLRWLPHLETTISSWRWGLARKCRGGDMDPGGGGITCDLRVKPRRRVEDMIKTVLIFFCRRSIRHLFDCP